MKIGDIAGCLDKYGYVIITVDGVSFAAHRLVWFYHYNVWPDKIIDHINGDPSDNRIDNLRDVSVRINAENASKRHRADLHLPTGVAIARRSRSGTPISYMAYWQDTDYLPRSKWFSVKKYGSDEDTIIAASAYRDQVIASLVAQGAGYTLRHGKQLKERL